MKFKLKISKKVIWRLLLFTALAGVALILDAYFENHPEALDEFQAESEGTAASHGTIYIFSQASNFTAKTPVYKTPNRRLFAPANDKFIRRCHQLRNQLALKADEKTPRKPVFLSYHSLVFRHYYFSLPDDEPLVS